MEKNAVRAEPSDVTPWRQEDMIEPAARDVLARLEVRDAHERERGVARSERLRQNFVFLDAEKEDYLRFYELIVPQMNPGATLVADNLISHEPELAEFRERALSDDRLSAVIVPIGRGELLAVRAPTR
jgi:predicted O-methyltransferase YrrM